MVASAVSSRHPPEARPDRSSPSRRPVPPRSAPQPPPSRSTRAGSCGGPPTSAGRRRSTKATAAATRRRRVSRLPHAAGEASDPLGPKLAIGGEHLRQPKLSRHRGKAVEHDRFDAELGEGARSIRRKSALSRCTTTGSRSRGRIGTPRVKRCLSSISSKAEKLLEWPLCGVAVRGKRGSFWSRPTSTQSKVSVKTLRQPRRGGTSASAGPSPGITMWTVSGSVLAHNSTDSTGVEPHRFSGTGSPRGNPLPQVARTPRQAVQPHRLQARFCASFGAGPRPVRLRARQPRSSSIEAPSQSCYAAIGRSRACSSGCRNSGWGARHMVRYVSRKGSQISERPWEGVGESLVQAARVRDAAPPWSNLAERPVTTSRPMPASLEKHADCVKSQTEQIPDGVGCGRSRHDVHRWSGPLPAAAFAVRRDKSNRVFADPDKIHRVRHHGQHYQVDAIHLAEPSPQRTPVLYQAGSSIRGREFAAMHAECVFVSGRTSASPATS